MTSNQEGVFSLLAAALLAVVLLFFVSSAHAVPPNINGVPIVSSPAAPAAPPSAPSSQPVAAGGHGPTWLGWAVMGFVVVFDYLIICQVEEKRDPERFKFLQCPKTPDWKVAPPFTTGP